MTPSRILDFDEHTRDEIRLAEHVDRERAATLSDVLIAGALMETVLIEAVALPLSRGDVQLARRASFAHAVAVGLTLLVGNVIKVVVGRPRPFERECAANPGRHGCGHRDAHASFYSLHTATAFASAGFACAMRVSGRDRVRARDALSCGASIAVATTIGVLRVVSDRHYLSDVVMGAAMGFAAGYLVPRAVVKEPAQNPRSVPATRRKVVTPSPASNVSVPMPIVIVKA